MATEGKAIRVGLPAYSGDQRGPQTKVRAGRIAEREVHGGGLVVVTHNQGLTVAEMTDLRRKIRNAGASFRVTKNRLTRLALAGTKFEGLGKLFTGPTAIAYSKDPVAAAKVVVDFAKGNDKLVILGAALGGKGSMWTASRRWPPCRRWTTARQVDGHDPDPRDSDRRRAQAPGAQIARVLAANAKKGEAA